ncbi:MAG TPA: VWA domain-containing protein [Vicinamibacteria bacterium]|nr:VWA domain-containing protein [Vicinamibacteria bacterium]
MAQPYSTLVSIAWLLTLATTAGAQVPTFASRSELVVLSATAVDDRGRPVTNLRQPEFTVLEDGRPQSVLHFSAGPAVSARVLILVDASGSMNAEVKAASARMAVTQFLAALSPDDQVALAGFDSEYWGIVSWTKDRRKVEEGVRDLKPFGSTALHDALDRAARDLASHGEGRRAVVVLTDGVDTASKATADEVIARSRALDVPIYAVSVVAPIDDPRSELFAGGGRVTVVGTGSALLDRYASMSGGAAFVVSDFAGLKKAADLIALEFKHQYRLGYDPPEGPARFRRVEVRTTRKGVLVRTRSGYVPSS